MAKNKQLYCFEVDTLYKSGRKRNEVIISTSRRAMWRYYDKHHNKNLIEWSAVVDEWVQ